MFRLSLLLFLISSSVYGTEITTGNLLPNTGNGQDWNSSSTDIINSGSNGYVSNGSTVDGFTVTCSTDQSNCGYKHDTGGDFEVTGTAKLSVNDISLTTNSVTQSMLDNGITLNSKIDVANCDSVPGNCEGKKGNADSHTTTVQLKDSSGNLLSTSSQTRNNPDGFQGNCNGYPSSNASGITTGCGQYTDTITYTGVGANKVDWAWTGTDGNSTSSIRGGPNLLGSSLTMTYNNQGYTPINDDTQDIIDDVKLPPIDEEDWYDDSWEYMTEDDWSWEDDYVIIEDDYMDDFEDFEEFEEYDMEFDIEIIDFEEFEIIDFDEQDFDFFEEIDFDMAPPEDFFEEDYGDVEIMEEIFEEEFEEEFTTFLEDSGMAEEFEAFLQEEGMTEQEFFEEITEEEFNDEFTEESFEEIDEPMEEVATNEESVSEVVETETEAMEPEKMEEPASEKNQEDSVVKNDTEPDEPQQDEQKEESDSTESEDSEVQAEESGEQEIVQQDERKVESKDRITTDVAKIESKVNKNLKNVAKQIAKIVKQNTKNLTKEELFFKDNNTLNAYTKTDFYKSKNIYSTDLGLFTDQLNLGVYSEEIYQTASLNQYIENDQIEVHKKKLYNISRQKDQIMLELDILRGK